MQKNRIAALIQLFTKAAFMQAVLICCCCVYVPALAQTTSSTASTAKQTIKGKVVDEKGLPIAGVTVQEKGNSLNGTQTADDGGFSIKVAPNGKLELSHINYEKQTVNVSGQKTLDIKMTTAQGNMSDVIVVGVQRQSKKTTTSAVASISGKQIENIPAASPDALLQGRVSGLNVQILSGEPGVAPTMVVRGNNRASQNIGGYDQARSLAGPLYVIDGVPVNPEDIASSIDASGTNYLAGLNVNDIESIDVQKDAVATAAWGSRGANGVVYITTRKGKSSTPELRLNAYAGITQQPKLLPTITGAEERRQKLALAKRYGTPAQINTIPQLLTDSLNPYFNNATDWQGMFYQNGVVKNVDMSLSAATDVLNYRLSANYFDEQGVIKAFGFKRYSMRGNFDFKISPKLNSQLIVGLSKSDRQRGRKYNNSDDNTPVSSFDIPTSFYKLNSFDSLNYMGMFDKLRNQNLNDWYSASLTLNYDIMKGLRFTTQGSANTTMSSKEFFQPTDISKPVIDGGGNRSYASSDKGTFSNYFLSNSLNWFKTFGKKEDHNLVLTANQQFTRDIYSSTIASGFDVPSNNIQVVNGIPQQSYDDVRSTYGASAVLSFLGQVSYDYKKKYLLYAGQRADASSRFGKNSKWGTFPSVGAGWVISDEKFMEATSSWLNFLKVRTSYGTTGSQSSDYYAPYNAYELNGTYDGTPVINPSYTNGLSKDDLTWAKTTQKNIAIETRFLNNRISLTVEAYDKVSKGDYFNFGLPFFVGFKNITFNANDLWVNNRGLEFQVTSRNLPQDNKLQWTTSLNMAFNKNIIAKLPNNNRTFIENDPYDVARIYAVGHPVYQMFQLQYMGVYNRFEEIPYNPITGKRLTYFKGANPVVPGDPIWKDVNGDYDVWSDENNGDLYGDRVPTGNPNPLFTGGLVNDLAFGNFNLSIVGVFAFKRDVINSFEQGQIASSFNTNQIQTFAKKRLPDLSKYDYWTPDKAEDPNYKAGFPSLNPFGSGVPYKFGAFSTMFNEDGSYFKIKTVSLSYRIPKEIVSRAKLKGVRVYSLIDNLFVFKNSSMPDPELVNELGVYTGGAFPIPRKFTFGLDIQF